MADEIDVSFIKEYEGEELFDYLIEHKLIHAGETLLTCFKRLYPLKTEIIKPNVDIVLNTDQQKAWQKISVWQTNEKPYFVLSGSAGTGKTTLIKMLAHDKSIFFTGTTNKAAKVLSKVIGIPVKTIYSQLGLRMVEDDEQLVLKQSDSASYLPQGSIIVTDEASMCGSQLFSVIIDTVKKRRLKVLFVGDPAQLPPVGETKSAVWSLVKDKDCKAFLKKVMRNDNELLALAKQIRDCIKYKEYDLDLNSIGQSNQIVKFKNRQRFIDKLVDEVKAGCDLHETKVVAWRNKTVNFYNDLIRANLGYDDVYNVGDILLLAEPIEIKGNIIAHIDDEFTINFIGNDKLKVDDYYIETWRLEVSGDKDLTLQIPKKINLLNMLLNEKVSSAKIQTGKIRLEAWRDFWDTKRKFHSVRYGYALTAHRAQGSTYSTIFADIPDILANGNQRESFRCLYVGVTRPSTKLYLY